MMRSSKSMALAWRSRRWYIAVGLAHLPLVVAGAAVLGADPRRIRLLVDEVVLEVAHRVRERPRLVALRVEVEVAQDQGHQALAVGGVVDREGRLQAEPGRLAAQDPHARRVERHHPHRLGARADEVGDPLLHLAGRLVGEGDGEDLAGLDVPGGQQVGDPVGEDPGLAGPGTGDDEQRRAVVDDGLALLRVQALEQLLRVVQPAVGVRRATRSAGRVRAAVRGGPQRDSPLVDVSPGYGTRQVEVVEEGAGLGCHRVVQPTSAARHRRARWPVGAGCGGAAGCASGERGPHSGTGHFGDSSPAGTAASPLGRWPCFARS